MTKTNYLSSWAGALLGVAMMSVSAMGLEQDQSAVATLDTYLATELGYDAEKIERFKSSIADMAPEQLQSLVNRMKFQRDLQADDRVDINAENRERRLNQNDRNIRQLLNAKAHAERFKVGEPKK